MTDIYATLGPACADEGKLQQMFAAGLSGLRLNLSHMRLDEAEAWLTLARRAAGRPYKLLIDLQGPELRLGPLPAVRHLAPAEHLKLGAAGIAAPSLLLAALRPGQIVLVDDGKLRFRVLQATPTEAELATLMAGPLAGGKSIAIEGLELQPPALTAVDRENLALAKNYGVFGVMQPFVRSRADLLALRAALAEAGAADLKIFAKIENPEGVAHWADFADLADELIIARGDLGMHYPLWTLPALQKELSAAFRQAGRPFMVVTQLLSSMETRAVPSRADLNDIFNALLDGAHSVMVTGETAVGAYPVEVVDYLVKTVRAAEAYLAQH